MMAKEGIVFSDMDGTLLFHEELHGMQEQNRASDGLVRVLDPETNRTFVTRDVSSDLYRVFLDVETEKLIHALKEKYHFVIVSAARKSTMDSRKKQLAFADAYILESGGVILNGDYSQDMAWSDRIAPEIHYLAAVQKQLQSEGWVLDIKGRTTALRVRKKDNPARSDAEFSALCGTLQVPPQLTKTMNIGNLDVILAGAGKGNSVDYLTSVLGFDRSQTIGIGDDVNDIDLLTHTGTKYVLGSAYPQAIAVARTEGWYVSQGRHFDGINEILRHVISGKSSQ